MTKYNIIYLLFWQPHAVSGSKIVTISFGFNVLNFVSLQVIIDCLDESIVIHMKQNNKG